MPIVPTLAHCSNTINRGFMTVSCRCSQSKWSFPCRGELLPPSMSWLHDFGILHDIGVRIVDTFEILTAIERKSRIQAAEWD